MGFLWSYFCDLTCVIMFLRRIERRKNGKTHLYWSLVENKRLDDGRVVQRHVYYLGEINSSQAEVWRKAIEVFDTDAGGSRTLALFPEDRCEVSGDDASVVRLRLSEIGSIVRGSGAPVVARAATRPVLGRAPAREPEANAL